MQLILTIKKKILLSIVNKVLKGTRFFKSKSIILKMCGYSIGENTKIVGPLNIGMVSKLYIGNDCWIGRDFTVDGNGTCIIGNNVDIASEVLIHTGSHYIGDKYRRAGKSRTVETSIQNGCWIGVRSIIIEGATILEGSVVGAGAVVHKTHPANSLICGVPGEFKRYIDE